MIGVVRMEFKDRLKELRKEKAVSQKELGDAIFVSRSAVAKWENGLGTPNEESYAALLRYFAVTSADLPLGEEETAAALKNRRMRVVKNCVFYITLFTLLILSLSLIALFDNGYGFTSEMAAGELWADNMRIETPEYDFYFSAIPVTGLEEETWLVDGLKIVKKTAVGYRVMKDDELKSSDVYLDGEYKGRLLSLKGKTDVYNLYFQHKLLTEEGMYLTLFDSVRIKEETFEVQYNCFFVTPSQIIDFYIRDDHYTIGMLYWQ